VLSPSAQAATTVKKLESYADAQALFDVLAEQVRGVRGGNLNRPEAMLVAQAHTLDALFNRLTRRAAMNMGEYLEAVGTYLKLALRAQRQCRATPEAFHELKNPRPVSFVRQANIAHGHQQVNNQAPAPRAGKTESSQNELLEQIDR
jgi:hypothetical protein